MSRFKKYLAILIVGGIGGVLANNFVLPFLARVNFLGSAQIIGKIINYEKIPQIEKQVVVVTKGEYFSEAISKTKSSIVSVQSFSGGNLIRSGSGVILTQDGLVATLTGLVPPETEVVQISTEAKIYRGKVVYRDYQRGVALLYLGDSGLSVANLKYDLPNLGSNLLLFSRSVDFGNTELAVAESLVSKISETNQSFGITANYDSKFYGASLIDVNGDILGITTFKNGETVLISSKYIKAAMDAYFLKQQKGAGLTQGPAV
jgi:hypothetical protein